jgi:hypothetical protein
MSRPGRDAPARTSPARDRGQIVLVAAAVVAVALLSMTLAYAQLGYDADRTGAGTAAVAPMSEVDRSLATSLRAAARAERRRADSAWREHRAVAERIREAIRTDLRGLERVHAGESRSLSVGFDDGAASQFARNRCPDGRGREFGPCRAVGGIVVQERARGTAVVAAAFRVRIVSTDESTTATIVSRTVPQPDPAAAA